MIGSQGLLAEFIAPFFFLCTILQWNWWCGSDQFLLKNFQTLDAQLQRRAHVRHRFLASAIRADRRLCCCIEEKRIVKASLAPVSALELCPQKSLRVPRDASWWCSGSDPSTQTSCSWHCCPDWSTLALITCLLPAAAPCTLDKFTHVHIVTSVEPPSLSSSPSSSLYFSLFSSLHPCQLVF